MNVIRVYGICAFLLFAATLTLVIIDKWQWALVPVSLLLGLGGMAVAALIQQQQMTNSLLRSQLNALMAFFSANGVKVEGLPEE